MNKSLAHLIPTIETALRRRQDDLVAEASLMTARRRVSVRRIARLLGYRIDEGANAQVYVQVWVRVPHLVVPRATRIHDGGKIVFETLLEKTLHRNHNTFSLYVDGGASRVLPQGATQAVLQGEHPHLEAGDVLIFQSHTAHPTTLTGVHVHSGQTRIHWSDPFPISLDATACTVLGNVLLADHGETRQSRQTLPIQLQHLIFKEAPVVSLQDSSGWTWTPRYDLLDCSGEDRVFVAELDADGTTTLRFGDGRQGRRPDPDTSFVVTYRAGTGGNIPANTLTEIDLPDGELDGVEAITNPLPAWGGREPESIEALRLRIPQQLRSQSRAVTVSDYTQVAEAHPAIQRAHAHMHHRSGKIHVVVERVRHQHADDAFLEDIRAFLEPYRLVGQDIEVVGTSLVPLVIEMNVLLNSRVFRRDARPAILHALVDVLHPDRFGIGETVRPAPFIAAAMTVEGVENVQMTRFQRLGPPQPAQDWILLLPHETAQARFQLVLEGGL